MKKITTNFKKALGVYQKRKKFITTIILLVSILFPFYISIRDIAIDSIPFWYDPARDLLMAWDNFVKPALIGPPSGIPGIFYGPQWIWFLSLGLLFSKDPRAVAALILSIPYFTVFPFVLFKFAGIFGKRITLIIWLLFVFGYKSYTTYIWSPHLAPLFFLILVFLLIFTDREIKKVSNILSLFLAGIFAGLLVNVHISFGTVMTLAAVLFLAVSHPKNRITAVFSFILGLLISFSPNLIFEMRHGFHQTQAILATVSTAFIYHATVTGLSGLTPPDIIKEFFGVLGKLLHTPQNITFVIYAVLSVYILKNYKKYLTGWGKLDKKLLLFLAVSTLCLFAVYLSSKNPIWSYHFIGAEIIILFLLGLVMTKFEFLTNILTVFAAVLVFYNIYLLTLPSEVPLLKMSNLATKKHVVRLIYEDAKKEPFAVFTYSPAIYTYDYDYILRWFGTDKYPNQLPKDISQVKVAYLIIPKTSEPIMLDFINYKTPNKEFYTTNEWKINDGTVIIRRDKKEWKKS